MSDMTLEEAVSIARQAEKESRAFQRIAQAGHAIVQLHEASGKAQAALDVLNRQIGDAEARVAVADAARREAEQAAAKAQSAAVVAAAEAKTAAEKLQQELRDVRKQCDGAIAEAREGHQRAIAEEQRRRDASLRAIADKHKVAVTALDEELAEKRAQLEDVKRAIKELGSRFLAEA